MAVASLVAGCAFVRPRFQQDVAASFARTPMRRMETAQAVIYYPEPSRAAALRIAARMEVCLERLRALSRGGSGEKALVFLTSSNFNNAYVTGNLLGEPLHTVIPLATTSEVFNWFNLGQTDPGDIACHELVHTVQAEQVRGLWGGVNWLLGPVMDTQLWTERWFLEGLAQYYEGRLGEEVGRPHSALYRQMYESIVQARGGDIGPSELNLSQRTLLPFSGAYLTGLHFVEFLARKYGEERLWRLVDEQARSLLPPIGVTLRFKGVFGRSVGALLEEYAAELRTQVAARDRPGDQRLLSSGLGYIGRLAGCPADSSMARVSAGLDEVVQLAIHERDGSLRFAVPLTELAPGRRWTFVDPLGISGMSYTADGRWLYLMNEDFTVLGDFSTQLWRVDPRDGEISVVAERLRGSGGSVSPKGDRYVYVEIRPEGADLVELDLRTLERRQLTQLEPGAALATPAYSPDGERIAFAWRVGRAFHLFLREADGRLTRLTEDGRWNYAPRWIDGRRLLFSRELDGRPQAHVMNVETGRLAPTTSAPFAVLDPAPIGGEDLAFLNRDGWSWSLDAAPIAAVPDADGEDSTSSQPQASPSREEPAPEARVERDEPYSHLDGLFAPTLRVPFALVYRDQATGALAQLYALSLMGQDRLAFHRWALNATLSLPERSSAVSLQYGNHQLAPWFGLVGLSRTQQGPTTDWLGVLSFGRAFWTTPVSLDLTVLDRAVEPLGEAPGFRARLVGPGASFSYLAVEATPYGGIRRALGFAGAVHGYPRALGNLFTLLDVEAEVTLAPRLPLLARHSLLATLRGRALPGSPDELLQVGGVPAGALFAFNETPGEQTPGTGLPGLAFAEGVRGYEDHAVFAKAAGVVQARYRYPFVIDHGWASTLYLLPSLFVRQLDVELFGAAAFTDSEAAPMLRAAGAAVSLRTAVMQVFPLSLTYQVAARFDRGLPPLHLVGLSLE